MSMGRGTAEVLGNPRAFLGGLAGAALVCAALAAAFTSRPASAEVPEGPEVDFQPGVLTPLGIVYPDDIKVITADLQSAEAEPPEQVTTDDTPPEKVTEPPKPIPDPPKPAPTPTPPKPDIEVGETNSESNNPYPDPPTVDQNPGNPFGDAQGWGELVKDGDPWATGVMKALNAMSIPAWAAQVPDGKYGFRLKVCKDGRISKVYTKTSSGKPSLDNAIGSELMRTRLPPMSAAMLKVVPGNCATLKYSFTWGGDRVR
jgi:outer membrane biosynthesis protein TonB